MAVKTSYFFGIREKKEIKGLSKQEIWGGFIMGNLLTHLRTMDEQKTTVVPSSILQRGSLKCSRVLTC
jgi:hypothetical protein